MTPSFLVLATGWVTVSEIRNGERGPILRLEMEWVLL